MEETLKDSVQKFSEAKRLGKPLAPVSPESYANMPIKVTKNIEASEIGVEVLNGRALWLWDVKRKLENTAKWLHSHQWTILAPPKRMKWLTSDNPVIHLGYTSQDDYVLERAWLKRKMNIMLPLSPQHLLFTQVGDPAVPQGTRMEKAQASFIRRVTAKNAFRFIFASDRDSEVDTFRRRRVDAEAFQAERKSWSAWHEVQSEAENDFGANPS